MTTPFQNGVDSYRKEFAAIEASPFLTCETEFVLFLAVLEISVLPMGWDGLNETLKVTSVVYKRYLRAVTKNSEWRSELAVIKRKL